MIRFWAAFAISLAATLAFLGGAGWGLSQALVSPPPAKFMTAAFEMDLAPGWSCKLEGTEFVCYPPGPTPHDEIAVMAMKYRSRQDTLDANEKHIATPQPAMDDERPSRLSTVDQVTRRWLAGSEWVSGRHLGSELPNFYTYYLATVTSHVGILVTFSAHRETFAERRAELERMLDSLIVYQRGL